MEPSPIALVVQHDEDKPLGLLVEPLVTAGIALDVRFAGRDRIELDGHAAVIALPSFENPVDETPSVHATREVLREALDRRLPALGLCLGSQLLAQAGGARAYACAEEYGYAPVEIEPAAAADRLLAGLPASIETFHAHSYAVELAQGAVALARTANALQAYRIGEAAWGIQVHPEPSVELVDEWIALHAGYMRTKGVDPDVLALEARRLEPAARELAATLAARFASVVHERVRA